VSNEPIPCLQPDSDELRFVSGESACPYLPGRLARHEAYWVERLSGSHYETLMDRGFRRSGSVVYRPRCRNCRACQPIRIPVQEFERTKSQQRVWRRNADVRVETGWPRVTRRKFQIFRDYLDARHDGTMARSLEAFEQFLYDSPTDTIEFCYFLGPRLVAVSIADQCPGGISSVYMFSDPAFSARSLGTFSILWEIDWCADAALAHYYLGYFVPGSRTMSYKARFRPHEILIEAGQWRPGFADGASR